LGDPSYAGDGYHYAATHGSDQQGHSQRDRAGQTEEVDSDVRRILQHEDDEKDQE
jgi:hypothetical protein